MTESEWTAGEPAGAARDYEVPTLDDVRAKIESRAFTAVGRAELDALTPEGKRLADTTEARAKAAQEALDAIRASLHRS